MSGPAEILSDRFEDVVGKQEVLRERYGILIPVMDDQKNLDPNEITEEEKTTGGSSGRAADRGSEAQELSDVQRSAQISLTTGHTGTKSCRLQGFPNVIH